jgi:hypothetical protein
LERWQASPAEWQRELERSPEMTKGSRLMEALESLLIARQPALPISAHTR